MIPAQPILATMMGLFLSCLAGGCASTRTVTVGPYAIGDQPIVRHAPETGFYKVQWLSADKREICTCAGTERLIVRGEPLGFENGPNGKVTAIAGIERFPLQRLPSDARYCQWHYRYHRETHFGESVDHAGEAFDDADAAAVELGLPSLLDNDWNFGKGDGGKGRERRSSHDGSHDRDHNTSPAPTSRKSE